MLLATPVKPEANHDARTASAEDIHSDISLSWKNIDVWAPPQFKGPPCCRRLVQPEKHILRGGK